MEFGIDCMVGGAEYRVCGGHKDVANHSADAKAKNDIGDYLRRCNLSALK